MEYQNTSIPGIVLITPRVYCDDRGFFLETFRENEFQDSVAKVDFVQENHSGSRQGVLRGLHYQVQNPQGKLVRVCNGKVFDVAVDIRTSSPTFGRWYGVTLSSQNNCQLWIPAGFAHGLYVISNWAEVLYKVTDYYQPQFERSIIWNDPTLQINWPLEEGTSPLLSGKDVQGGLFTDMIKEWGNGSDE